MSSERYFAEVTLSTDPTAPTKVHFLLHLWKIIGLYVALGVTLALLLSLFVPSLPVAAPIGGLCVAVLGPLNQCWVLRSEWKKRLTDPIIYRFSQEGIRATTKGIDSNIEWSRIRRVREIMDHWLLFFGEQEYMLIPTKQLGEQRAQLCDLLLKHQIRGASALKSG